MSVHDDTFKQLRDMGIDAPLARAAALRFTTTDAAVNWCFGEGMNVSSGVYMLDVNATNSFILWITCSGNPRAIPMTNYPNMTVQETHLERQASDPYGLDFREN